MNLMIVFLVWLACTICTLTTFAIAPSFMLKCLFGTKDLCVDDGGLDPAVLTTNTCILYMIGSPITILLILLCLLVNIIRCTFMATGTIITKIQSK